MTKHLIIVAGANGSGKTTFAKPYVAEKGYTFLNADEITKKLEEKGEANAMIKAGRIFFKNLHEWLAEGQSFVVETTLSGSYINKVAKKAQNSGYTIKIIYIFLDNPQTCIDRVKGRVIKGGHHVPTKDIIRRYYRSKKNFWENFRDLANEWNLYYNGDKGFQNVASSIGVNNHLLLELFHQNYHV